MSDGVQIAVDVRSVVPLSEQIRSQLAHLIRAGRLVAGARLPTVRTLASDLGVAVNTVNKAYAELDRDGLIVSKRRSGTHVTDTTLTVDSTDTQKVVSLLVEAAHRDRLDEETVIALVRQALRAKTTDATEHAGPVR